MVIKVFVVKLLVRVMSRDWDEITRLLACVESDEDDESGEEESEIRGWVVRRWDGGRVRFLCCHGNGGIIAMGIFFRLEAMWDYVFRNVWFNYKVAIEIKLIWDGTWGNVRFFKEFPGCHGNGKKPLLLFFNETTFL